MNLSLKNKTSLYGLIIILSVFVSCSTVEDQAGPSPNHVIVIGVDAMSPDGIRNAETPNLDQLMQNGSYTLNARGVLPTSSSTNWASMVSGAGPEQHGITSNGWERDDRNIPPIITGTEDIFPTIFGITRQQRPDIEMGAIYAWTGFGRLIERTALSYDITEDTDDLTTEKAITYIKSKTPGFLFIHLDHVDHVGHNQGHKTQEFYDGVSEADTQIGQIIQATKDAGMFEETIFIVSADHGGIGYGHGGESLDEIEIPFIIFGEGIKKGYLIKNKVYTYDTAATAAKLLNVKQPQAWIGNPVFSAFEGSPEPDLDNQKVLISAPTIYPKPNLYDPAGGLFIDKEPEVKMEVSGEYEIRYTLDGSVPDKNSALYTEPVVLTESSVVTARSFSGNQLESNPVTAFFRVVNSGSGNGINYTYYEENDSWSFLPVFESLNPISKGQTYEFRIGEINRSEGQFGIQYKAKIQIDTQGKYRFYTNSDDGSKLYINDDLVVDNDGGHGNIERMGSVELTSGKHDIRVDYHNQAGGFWLEVFYKGPGIPKQIIPADKLFPN
jgi:hypothetical protein